MVCNLVTYRARSAVREVGYALGFPRPLVDRVAKALETYDSVMVRRDLEADGGFAEFFRADRATDCRARRVRRREAEAHGLVDGMGQLNTRIPLVGKVPPWQQPPTPDDPDRPAPVRLAPGGAAEPEAEVGPSRLGDAGGRARVATSIRPGAVRRRGRPRRFPGERRVAAGGRGTGYGVLGPPPGTVPVDPRAA